MCRKNKNWIIGNKLLTLVLFCVALLCSMAFRRGKLSNIVVFINIIVALEVSLLLWYMFEHILFLKNCNILKLLDRFCLEIYVLHCFFTVGLRPVLTKAGIDNVYISIILNMIISTTVSILFSMLSCKLRVRDLIFKSWTFWADAVKTKGEQ